MGLIDEKNKSQKSCDPALKLDNASDRSVAKHEQSQSSASTSDFIYGLKFSN
jgi:hypothetical protein